jgi:uroporphyrinogen decarboxylase
MLDIPVKMDVPGLLKNLRRQGTPDRTFFIELYLDEEMKDAIGARFRLFDHLNPADPLYAVQRMVPLYRFLGYEAVRFKIGETVWKKVADVTSQDTAGLQRQSGRAWAREGVGPVASWEDFEKYPWPDPSDFDMAGLEWMERNIPDDMAIVGACTTVFAQASQLLGFEGMSYLLADQPDLAAAVFDHAGSIAYEGAKIMAQSDKVQIIFGGDDMGFNNGLLVSPKVLKEYSLPWHRKMAAEAHKHGKLYLLHACGDIREILPYLIDEVCIDARHSYQDIIEPVVEAKRRWGDRIAVLGGIDMDFLCRSDEQAIRKRVRETLDVCLPGGGYCLGTGNTVANYVPMDNYLIMLDEGRRYTA